MIHLAHFLNLFFNNCGNNVKVLNIVELYIHLAQLCCYMVPKSLISGTRRTKKLRGTLLCLRSTLLVSTTGELHFLLTYSLYSVICSP